jgi:hypothetical protein
MSYLRIGLAIAAALALAWLAHRVSLSFSQADTIEAQGEQIDTLNYARLRDTRIARELGVFRSQQSDWMRAFHDELGKKPLTKKVPPHVDPKTGAIEPCVVRDPVLYRRLFNEAVTGAPAGVP